MTSVSFCQAKESAVDKHCSKNTIEPLQLSHHVIYLTLLLWAITNAKNGKSVSKISKWPSVRPSSLKNIIIMLRFLSFVGEQGLRLSNNIFHTNPGL